MSAPLSDKAILQVRNLRTYFTTRGEPIRAVDDVSFDLARGRTLCVVGESGSGKSVTARSILQIVDKPGKIVGGQILMHRPGNVGKGTAAIDLASLDPKGAEIRAIRGKEIAMIFQEPMSSLSPVHTIGQQIIETIRLHLKMSPAEARARAIEVLAQVKIPRPAQSVDSYPFEFSGGMRQRAMIAMALSCNPDVLIADEPTTALDVTTQAEILDLIKELQELYGMAVMFITHDMGVVAEIADEVAVMYLGRLVERGPVDQIFHAPQHDYTKRLLNSVLKLETRARRKTAPIALSAAKPAVAAAAPPLLEVKNLKMHFPVRRGFFQRVVDTVKAVDDVTLSVRAGETLGIVGESGSGKTTLGRCLLRVYDPTAGNIVFRGLGDTPVDIANLPKSELGPVRRQIRMVFQDPFSSLNPRMTVFQIVSEPMRVNNIASGSDLEDRVATLLRKVGLPPEFMQRYPHAFSGGQRQRIGVARALALNPKLIVADEATSALDVSLRAQVLDLLLDLQDELGLSYVFVSHDISVIRYMCDRVAVMHLGKMVELDETETVCGAPKHPYTQALISAVPRPDPRRRGIAQRIRYQAPKS